MRISTFIKLFTGFVMWNFGVISYATIVHTAPTGLYWDDSFASIYEVMGIMMMIAYFIGVPVITGIWITSGEQYR